ncbi:MAG TPA: hypothetical protein VMZ91_02810 [Candidatus Paceibacterota bacterium]|nr:hypothetical protein [Candidatus Paceibacterota bacterium]
MIKKKLSNDLVFKSFSEYWYYARHLSARQRNIVFNSLPLMHQSIITKSYTSGCWDDVFYKNVINEKIDELKNIYNLDLFDIRYKVMNNKSVYIPTIFWAEVQKEIGKYEPKDTDYILGDIVAIVCEQNKDVILLTKSLDSQREEI